MRHEEFMKQAALKADEAGVVMKDMVNSPPHYNKTGIECIDAIRAATGDGYEY